MTEMPANHNSPRHDKCLVITGPTATGKTALGVHLARHFRGEIISADSRQVYRGLDIGTGKDLEEYTAGGKPVKFHCLDIADPEENYNLFRYKTDAVNAILDCRHREHLPIIVGGTALYINALLDDYDLQGGPPDPRLREAVKSLTDKELLERLRKKAPEIYWRTDKTQRKRIVRALEIAETCDPAPPLPATPKLKLDPLLLAPYFPRSVIHARIKDRLEQRIEGGLLAEVEALRDAGVSWEWLERLGLEYRFAARYLQGQLSNSEFEERLLIKIRQFCKSQEIWFRKMEREGKLIYWIPGGERKTAENLVWRHLKNLPLAPPSIRLAALKPGLKCT